MTELDVLALEIMVQLHSFSGVLAVFSCWEVLGIAVAAVFFLGYFGASFCLWMLTLTSFLWMLGVSAAGVYLGILGLVVLFSLPFVRQYVLSWPLMKVIVAFKLLPKISETEQAAIDAGSVWVDGELFSGQPDLKRILSENYPKLSGEEKAFLEGPVERVCQMLTEWEVNEQRDLPKPVWDYLKKERFFGMGIPKQYGGLAFSAYAHSCVIAKLASRSIALAITVMVPNSLGPGELLTHYGTKAQKDHYLPRLAVGTDIPCFALTEPMAGSDAGAISSSGTVFKKRNGELYIRLNWCKRYITLAAISTVMGVAFKLSDPKNLLGKGEDLGITCALVPSDTKGVVLGKRHDPLGIPFYNCPTEGKDVEIPVSSIIGGSDWAGQGWRMLMESLSAGRGISLPANSTGGAKLVTRALGAYARIREQFSMSIGRFEGVQEVLARVTLETYILEAARVYTCGALDSGAKPAVVTALLKYQSTERFRQVINDGMDVMGGSAISEGPNNIFATAYKATPIGITVEGANILTRTLMVFGQGAIRCHPYVLPQIQALSSGDFKGFDRAFFSHIRHSVQNKTRAFFLTLSRGFFLWIRPSKTRSIKRRLVWLSAVFAFFSDVAMITLGPDLKRREMLTGRFADVFSSLYLLSAILRRYEADGQLKEDTVLLKASAETLFYESQIRLLAIAKEIKILFFFRFLLTLFPIGRPVSDAVLSEVAMTIQQPGAQRDRLTDMMYCPANDEPGLGRLEKAFIALHHAEPAYRKLKAAIRSKKLRKGAVLSILDDAVSQKVLSQKEAEKVKEAESFRAEAVSVDSFTLAEYLKGV